MAADTVLAEDTVRPFDPAGCRYDTSSYWGRLANMKDITDITTLLTSDEELEACQQLLRDFQEPSSHVQNVLKHGTPAEQQAMHEKLWHAKKIVDCIIHPATQTKMFWAGRMSAFVPVNLPVLMGMLVHGPTSIYAAAFWQWMNQSVNVFCNYVNRSGAEADWTSIMQSYAMAVGTSVGMAISAMKLMEAYPALLSLGPFVPYISVISASTANMLASRWQEWNEGITVTDAEGNVVGISKAAGVQAVWKTLWTRAWLLPIPLLVLPPFVMNVVRRGVKSKPVLIAAEVAVLLGMLHFALPAAIAVLPPTMELEVTELEPEFQQLTDKNGNRIAKVYANKGL